MLVDGVGERVAFCVESFVVPVEGFVSSVADDVAGEGGLGGAVSELREAVVGEGHWVSVRCDLLGVAQAARFDGGEVVDPVVVLVEDGGIFVAGAPVVVGDFPCVFAGEMEA